MSKSRLVREGTRGAPNTHSVRRFRWKGSRRGHTVRHTVRLASIEYIMRAPRPSLSWHATTGIHAQLDRTLRPLRAVRAWQ